MKKYYSLLAVASVVCIALFSFRSIQRPAEPRFAYYAIAFYNLENLFDTIHDVEAKIGRASCRERV